MRYRFVRAGACFGPESEDDMSPLVRAQFLALLQDSGVTVEKTSTVPQAGARYARRHGGHHRICCAVGLDLEGGVARASL